MKLSRRMRLRIMHMVRVLDMRKHIAYHHLH